MLKGGRNKVYINWKECEIEFTRLIGTWPGGKEYIEGEYKVTCEEEIIYLCLQLSHTSCAHRKIRKADPEEINEGFTRNKEDQEKFFKGEGKKLVIDGLIIAGGIERIKISKHKIHSPHNTTIEIKSVEKRN
ncbi:hypothetical protein ES702_02420 [subsurface metagenome]